MDNVRSDHAPAVFLHAPVVAKTHITLLYI